MWAEDLIITVEQRTRGSTGRQAESTGAPTRGARRTIGRSSRRSATRSWTARCARETGSPPPAILPSPSGLARNTVARAYDDLLAGGYLEGRVGSGTFVSAGVGELPRAPGRRRAVRRVRRTDSPRATARRRADRLRRSFPSTSARAPRTGMLSRAVSGCVSWAARCGRTPRSSAGTGSPAATSPFGKPSRGTWPSRGEWRRARSRSSSSTVPSRPSISSPDCAFDAATRPQWRSRAIPMRAVSSPPRPRACSPCPWTTMAST